MVNMFELHVRGFENHHWVFLYVHASFFDAWQKIDMQTENRKETELKLMDLTNQIYKEQGGRYNPKPRDERYKKMNKK